MLDLKTILLLDPVLIISPDSKSRCPVFVEDGSLGLVGKDVLDRFGCFSKVVVITDDNVGFLYSELLLNGFDCCVELINVPAGENSKSLGLVEDIVTKMFNLGCDRSTLVVALGGGMVGDLAGFVAAIFMRGVAFVQVPTTLLSMVDASIGGKNGVNLGFGKNLLGVIRQPLAIYVDPSVLNTLPEIEYTSGLAEVLKHGMIADSDLMTNFRLDKLVSAMKVKVDIVNADVEEQGLRKLLNVGHTVGHALEHLSDYSLPHGFAVSLGVVVENMLAVKMGIQQVNDFETMRLALLSCGLPVSWESAANFSADEVWEVMLNDKKNSNGNVVCAFVAKIGVRDNCVVKSISFDDFSQVWSNFISS